MASLLLGPLLRHVDADGATVWVETDSPCEVSIAGSRARTWEVEGHHFALVEIGGLEPGEAIPYEVELDGRSVWPPPEYEFPAPTIRPLGSRKDVRLIFGSCRVSLPNEPPYVLHQSEHPDAQGIDALRTLALRIMRSEERAPDCLLMLGDQIYADDLSPAMKELAAARARIDSAPAEELADFGEYALAYREAWSEPVIRWLLSTVPTAMIFDDHEIHAQWKISRRWQDRCSSHRTGTSGKIIGGLVAYWVFQHIGNLSPRELARVRAPRAGEDRWGRRQPDPARADAARRPPARPQPLELLPRPRRLAAAGDRLARRPRARPAGAQDDQRGASGNGSSSMPPGLRPPAAGVARSPSS